MGNHTFNSLPEIYWAEVGSSFAAGSACGAVAEDDTSSGTASVAAEASSMFSPMVLL